MKISEVGILIKTVAGLSMDGLVKVIAVSFMIVYAATEVREQWFNGDDDDHQAIHTLDAVMEKMELSDEFRVTIINRMDIDDVRDMELEAAFIQATFTQQLMQQKFESDIENLEQSDTDHVNFLHQ